MRLDPARTRILQNQAFERVSNGTGAEPYGPNLHARFVQIGGNERNTKQMNGRTYD